MNELKEFFEASDGIVNGFVVITDKTIGKIILQKKNMILKDGKDALLAKFLLNTEILNNANIDETLSGNLNDLSSFLLKEAIFYYNDNEVSYTDNQSLLFLDNINQLSFELEKQDLYLTTENNHTCLKIVFDITLDNTSGTEVVDSKTVNSLSLVMTDESNNKKLFSRIRFDPIILTPENKMTIQYYVYF